MLFNEGTLDWQEFSVFEVHLDRLWNVEKLWQSSAIGTSQTIVVEGSSSATNVLQMELLHSQRKEEAVASLEAEAAVSQVLWKIFLACWAQD